MRTSNATKGHVGSQCRIALVAYDAFSMAFLDRPGAYYKVDCVARRERGTMTPQRIVSSLVVYYGYVQQGSAAGDGIMTQRQVVD